MKKLLPLLSFVTVLCLSFVLYSCNESNDPIITQNETSSAITTNAPSSENAATVSETVTIETTGAPESEKIESLFPITIDGNDISLYTIVYAKSPYYSVRRRLSTDYDFFKFCAERLQSVIREKTGIELKLIEDSKNARSDYEILVGPTNRQESEMINSLDAYTYHDEVIGSKFIVGGGYDCSYLVGNLKTSYCWGASYHAIDPIEKMIIDAKDSLDFASGFRIEEKADLKTVACIGDSITEGFLSTDWNYTSYPAVMQRVLWQDYIVLNYGLCAKTMRNDLTEHYKQTQQYGFAIKYADLFDVVTIMLGTNDSHFDADFSITDDESYNSSALELVKKLTEKNESMKITVMNCPIYYGTGTSATPHVRNLQAKLVSLFKENGYDETYFFDMYTFTKEKLTRSHFPDALHPDDEGYALMGKRLAEVIPQIVDSSWDALPELVNE